MSEVEQSEFQYTRKKAAVTADSYQILKYTSNEAEKKLQQQQTFTKFPRSPSVDISCSGENNHVSISTGNFLNWAIQEVVNTNWRQNLIIFNVTAEAAVVVGAEGIQSATV